MIVAIHQPHFFPWTGYFDKMAKVEQFVLLDEVQFEKGSYMYRNRILNDRGQPEYLTISADKHGYLEKRYCDLFTTNDEGWTAKHISQIKRSYKHSPYFDEVWRLVSQVYSGKQSTICEYALKSIEIVMQALGISTRITLQSELTYPDSRKNNLVLALCKAVDADGYLSGNGAKKYTDEESFSSENIKLCYQQFDHPQYVQQYSGTFIPGLSALDMLFSCGIDKSRELFWNNVRKTNEFDIDKADDKELYFLKGVESHG